MNPAPQAEGSETDFEAIDTTPQTSTAHSDSWTGGSSKVARTSQALSGSVSPAFALID